MEALLEESRLIKLHQPPFNVLLRSYRNFPFVKIDDSERYPRLIVTRELHDDGASYFGPFKSVRATEQALTILSRCFRLWDGQCPERSTGTSCLYYQMGRCLAPCQGPDGLARHRKAIEDVCRLLETEPEELLTGLIQRRDAASERLDFETAALYRDGIDALRIAVERKRLLVPAIEGLNTMAVCPSIHADWAEIFVFGHGRLLDRARLFVGEDGPDYAAVVGLLRKIAIGWPNVERVKPADRRWGLDQVNIILNGWKDECGCDPSSEPNWAIDRFIDVAEMVTRAARVAVGR